MGVLACEDAALGILLGGSYASLQVFVSGVWILQFSFTLTVTVHPTVDLHNTAILIALYNSTSDANASE